MNIYIDAEFWEDGPSEPIRLISLGLVSQAGGEMYLISEDFDWEACDSTWLKTNVAPMLHLTDAVVAPLANMANLVFKWVVRETGGKKPAFWGYYSDYDWVVFCQIFGRMVDLPELFPKYCLDLKQLALARGNPELPKQGSLEHNALHDARWNKQAHDFLLSRKKVRKQAGA
jgi:hypothetical protein